MSTSEAATLTAITVKKSERKGSVMIEASLGIPDEKISEVQVKKDGVIVQTKEEQAHSKISITRKSSTASQKETVVQLEIENAKPEDEGRYEIVAKDKTGEVQTKKISITKKEIHQVVIEGSAVEKIDIADGTSVNKEVTEESSIAKSSAAVEESNMTEAVTEVQQRKMSRTETVTEVQERKMSVKAEEEEKPKEAEASPFGVKKLRKVSRTEELKEGTPATGSSKEQTPEAEASPFGLKKLRKVSRQEDTKESTPSKEAQEAEKPKLRKVSKAESEQSQASQKDAPAEGEDAAEALATSGVTEVKKKKKKVVKKKKKKEEPLEPPEFVSYLKTQVWWCKYQLCG